MRPRSKVPAIDVLMGASHRCFQSLDVSVGTSSSSSIVVVMVRYSYLYKCINTNLNKVSKIWTVKQISKLNAKEHKFDVTEKATGKVTNMSVYEYFQKKYNVPITKPWLPLVQTQKAGVLFPMEVCVMCDGQRYPYKLNSDQVRGTCTITQENIANIFNRRPI